VPQPVLRPVDIDMSKTGFDSLRSLRIYRFDQGSVIDGHAEEDEVLIVLLSGSIELTLIDAGPDAKSQTFTLSAADGQHEAPCAAYLPPLAAYRLVAGSEAEVAYARATPADGPPPRVFTANHPASGGLLWEELTYPRMLRARVMKIAAETDVVVAPVPEREAGCEALLHVRSAGIVTFTVAESAPAPIASWDTVAIAPGEPLELKFVQGSSAVVLAILAEQAVLA
jgi:hypothetical protein